MNVITINVGQGGCNAAPLLIGYAGEDSVDAVDFDFSAWAQDYGEGTISLELMRASDTAPYLAILTVDGTTARWTVSDVDTARSGPGVAQLIYKPARGTKKSAIYKFYVGRSLTEPGGDDPWGPIIERMEEILAEVKEQAEAADQSAEDASGSARDAEAWAVGERGGEPVPATDETHENNAKYYAEQAGETAREFSEVTAPAAVRAVNEAGQTQTQAITDAGAAAVQAVSAERAGALDAIGTARAGALDAIGTAGQTAASAVDTAKTGAVQAVNTAKTDALAAIEQKSTAEQAAVEQKGEDALAALQEYADLPGEVDDLKSAIKSVDNLLDFYSKQGSGTQGATYTLTTLVGDIPLKSGETYTVSVTIDSVQNIRIYAYLQDSSGNNLTTFGVSAGELTASVNYTPTQNIDGCKLVFQCGIANFTAHGDVKKWSNVIDRISTDVSNLTVAVDAVAPKIEPINGEIYLDDLFEFGSIAIATTGWVYSDSANRIRTKEGTTIFLLPGDIITLETTGYRFYLGWKNLSDAYGTSGAWITNNSVIMQGGYYVLTASKDPESQLASINDVLQHIKITRCVNLTSKAMTVNPNIIGVNHRGYNYFAPENTIPAFMMSKEKGFNYIETDLAFTRDNVPVLLHDETIDRTSNGTGRINDLDYSVVSQYDFGSWKSSEYTGTKIPTLEEMLKYCKYANLNIFLEIKGTSHGTTTENIMACINLVKKHGMVEAVTWISYTREWLDIVKTALPTAQLGLLADSVDSAVVTNVISLKTSTNNVFLDSGLSSFTDAVVGELVANDIEGGCYTPDNLNQINSITFIRYVTTNIMNVPEALLSYASINEA